MPLEGVWDGEKVQFDDKDKTVVRSIRWLKKYKKYENFKHINKKQYDKRKINNSDISVRNIN